MKKLITNIKIEFYFMLILFLIFQSCKFHQPIISKNIDQNSFIEYAITDFVKTDTLFCNDSVFSVSLDNVNNKLLVVSILVRRHKFYPGPYNKIGTSYGNLPTDYLVKEDKLFHWYDSTKCLTKDLVKVLNKYNRIDSLNVNSLVSLIMVTGGEKSTDYYFCKCNKYKFKKNISSVAVGWYKPPRLRCRCKDR